MTSSRGDREAVLTVPGGARRPSRGHSSRIDLDQVATLANVYRRLSRRHDNPRGDAVIKVVVKAGIPLGILGFMMAGDGTLGLLGAALIAGAVLSYHLTASIVVARDTDFLAGTSLSGTEARLGSAYYLATEAAAIATVLLFGILVETRAASPLMALSSYATAVLVTVAIGALSLRFRHLRRATIGVALGITIAGAQFAPTLMSMAARVGAVVGASGYVVANSAMVALLAGTLVVGMSGADVSSASRPRMIRARIPQLGRFNATGGTATARTEEKLGFQGILLYVALSLFELLVILSPTYRSAPRAPTGAPPGVFHPVDEFLLASLVVVILGQFMMTRRTVPGLMEDPELAEWSFLRATPMPAALIALGFSLPGIAWTAVFGLAGALVLGLVGPLIGSGSAIVSPLAILGLVVASGLATPLVVMASLLSRRLGRSLVFGPAIARGAVMLIELIVGATVLMTLGSSPIAALIASLGCGAAIGGLGLGGSAMLIRRDFRTLT